MKDRKDLQTTDGDAWTSQDELEFQIGFDMPIYKEQPEKPKSPRPTKPIKERRIPEAAKKHIKRSGKK